MSAAPRRLPSGRWQGRFRHPVTRRWVTSTFDYAYEAEAWAITEEERARSYSGEVSPGGQNMTADVTRARWVGPTVGDYGRRYLDRRRGHVARATLNKYDAHLSGLAVQVHPDRPAPAAVAMGLLTKPDVEQWVTDSLDAHVGRPTINGRLRLLRQLYADLLDGDDPPADLRDPTRGIAFLTEDQDPDRVLTHAEETTLLAAAGPQLRDACLVALDAGLRWQEVYALRVSSVVGSYLVVSHVLERGTAELRAFTKGKRTRVVPTTERLAARLDVLVDEARTRGDGLLFPNPSGSGPWGYDNHRKREWLPTLASIGFAKVEHRDTGRRRVDGSPVLQRRVVAPEFGFHALRHTYGTRLADAGVPRHEIAELMGHANERTTGRYIHAGTDGRRLALVRDALGGRGAA